METIYGLINENTEAFLIIILAVSIITNMLWGFRYCFTRQISKKTMENLYNTEIEISKNCLTKEEKDCHKYKAAGMMDVYTHMGFEPKVYENDHIKL